MKKKYIKNPIKTGSWTDYWVLIGNRLVQLLCIQFNTNRKVDRKFSNENPLSIKNFYRFVCLFLPDPRAALFVEVINFKTDNIQYNQFNCVYSWCTPEITLHFRMNERIQIISGICNARTRTVMWLSEKKKSEELKIGLQSFSSINGTNSKVKGEQKIPKTSSSQQS